MTLTEPSPAAEIERRVRERAKDPTLDPTTDAAGSPLRAPVDLRRLVSGFLRMAPDVAIVGEVRDREALPRVPRSS